MTLKKSTLILILIIMAMVMFGIVIFSFLASDSGSGKDNTWKTIENEAAMIAAMTEEPEETTATTAVQTTAVTAAAPVKDNSSYNDGYASGYAAGLLDGGKTSKNSGNDAESYQKGYEAGLKDGRRDPDGNSSAAEPLEIIVCGSFTATVRAVLPDYQTDDETLRAAVIQFDRGDMFVMNIAPEVCKLLTPDETYTFLVDEQTVSVPSREYLMEDGALSADILRTQYIAVGSVRAPRNGETGSRGTRLTYKFSEDIHKGEIS
jgi:hypothetical protein